MNDSKIPLSPSAILATVCGHADGSPVAESKHGAVRYLVCGTWCAVLGHGFDYSTQHVSSVAFWFSTGFLRVSRFHPSAKITNFYPKIFNSNPICHRKLKHKCLCFAIKIHFFSTKLSYTFKLISLPIFTGNPAGRCSAIKSLSFAKCALLIA